jgi:hypothetical protein
MTKTHEYHHIVKMLLGPLLLLLLLLLLRLLSFSAFSHQQVASVHYRC